MRHACRKAFCCIALSALPVLHINAQDRPNGLVRDSVDPAGDSVMIAAMRHYSDSIRITEDRPVIALVLSGGGAKGAAQLGVIKVLEDLDIPIDMICGTSIGGLIGGMLSLGYDSDFIAGLFNTSNWSEIIYDEINPAYIAFDTKMFDSRHQIQFPFQKGFDIGADIKEKNTSFSASLPSGYTNGLHLGNLLSSLSVGYLDSLDFMDLPIPFFCVATDMVSCKEKNWGKGEFRTALRSTMSIPGLFNPVHTDDGMVLVDGGVRNNFPTDLARAMGADIIIGVSLSDDEEGNPEVNHIGNILSQFMSMLSKESFDRTVPIADIYIHPDISGYNMLSFNSEAIDTLFSRGHRAADENEETLKNLKEMTRGRGRNPDSPAAVNINLTPVRISEVVFTGVSDEESDMLQKKVGIQAGDQVNGKMLDDAVTRLYATGAFSEIHYILSGKEEPYRLIINFKSSPANQAGIGARVDTEEWASLLLDVGLNVNKLSGANVILSAKLGQNAAASVRFTLNPLGLPTVIAEADVFRKTGNIHYNGGKERFDFWGHSEKLYISNIRWTKFDIKAGLRNRYFKFIGNTYPGVPTEGDYLGAFANATLYTFDNRYYPLKGVNLDINYGYDFIRAGYKNFAGLHEISLNFKGIIPIGKFSIIPDLHLRNVLGDEFSISHLNCVGGDMAGRYLDQQIPFVGFNDVLATDRHTAVLNLAFRLNPVKNLFLSALGGYIKTEEDFRDMLKFSRPGYCGLGFEVGYNTIAGPLKANIHWSDLTNKVGFYFALGLDF